MLEQDIKHWLAEDIGDGDHTTLLYPGRCHRTLEADSQRHRHNSGHRGSQKSV